MRPFEYKKVYSLEEAFDAYSALKKGPVMGLGYALSEEVIFSEGKTVNDSFVDYRLPTMVDVPEIIPIIVEKTDARSPEDIRGVGSSPLFPQQQWSMRSMIQSVSG